MNFIDKANVVIKAGNGGDGRVSFRHEKFVDRGGPDGGDGGHGGNVVFIGSNSQNTLATFRFQRELKAKDGQAGGKTRKHGRNGEDLRIKVPVGTQVIAEDGTLLADLTVDGGEVVVAKGGRGGFGNAHFISSTRQAPKFAETGEQTDPLNATLELKMIADIGLVGLPNAGKSTFLARTSNARPEIANYPFTTIRPNLGVVDLGDTSLLLADIPGLIEGASQGKGLGDEFLRHVERTKVLVHMIDAYNEDLAGAYTTIQNELRDYKINLSDRAQLVALNKTDGLDDEMIDDLIKQLRTVVPEDVPIFPISAQAGKGVQPLLYAVKMALDNYVAEHVEELQDEIPTIRLTDTDKAWRVTRQGDKVWLVTGNRIEKFAGRTNFDNEEGVRRLRDIMRRMGILHELNRQGVEADDIVRVGGRGEFNF